MNTFKKKSLHAAVLAGLGALTAAGTADAVHINPDGLGQVLIFPYYTVRGGNFTAISIINTTSQTKGVKVRFLEGRASREVLDFNLWMSPQDVWTGAVVATADGARVISNDNSCVTPSDLFQELRPGLNDFKNIVYAATDYAIHGTTLDRSREGYFEVIEMGVVTQPVVTGFIKHGATGVPANCVAVDLYDALSIVNPAEGRFGSPTNILADPAGGLAGRSSIINSTNGSNYTLMPTAIDAWKVAAIPGVSVAEYSASGSVLPDLSAVSPRTTNVFVSGGVVSANWANGANTMSAILMRDTVVNEFVLDSTTRSSTDWIVTQPTKRLHVFPTTFTAPFTQSYNSANGGCEAYNVGVWDREEKAPDGPSNVILPSPRPPVTVTGSALCWEASVVPFQSASLLSSTNTTALTSGLAAFVGAATTTKGPKGTPSLPATQGPNGWFLMSFGGVAGRSITPTAATLHAGGVGVAPTVVPGVVTGLPVIGAMLNNYTNTATAGSLYGSVAEHRYTRLIN